MDPTSQMLNAYLQIKLLVDQLPCDFEQENKRLGRVIVYSFK